uniref:Uncharacterized protein n=3 Tax=Oryza TaxID=4527 RepID=Q2R5V5_ORYSJ|nr:hypothetical protein LOC_Os11g23210 [Oryza sativa Japonica Group]ABA93109.1 hypothetical protein LOC_Os11g23210 [Oryza sativa Japonica Group]
MEPPVNTNGGSDAGGGEEVGRQLERQLAATSSQLGRGSRRSDGGGADGRKEAAAGVGTLAAVLVPASPGHVPAADGMDGDEVGPDVDIATGESLQGSMGYCYNLRGLKGQIRNLTREGDSGKSLD